MWCCNVCMEVTSLRFFRSEDWQRDLQHCLAKLTAVKQGTFYDTWFPLLQAFSHEYFVFISLLGNWLQEFYTSKTSRVRNFTVLRSRLSHRLNKQDIQGNSFIHLLISDIFLDIFFAAKVHVGQLTWAWCFAEYWNMVSGDWKWTDVAVPSHGPGDGWVMLMSPGEGSAVPRREVETKAAWCEFVNWDLFFSNLKTSSELWYYIFVDIS